jgi:hypothetical protein
LGEELDRQPAVLWNTYARLRPDGDPVDGDEDDSLPTPRLAKVQSHKSRTRTPHAVGNDRLILIGRNGGDEQGNFCSLFGANPWPRCLMPWISDVVEKKSRKKAVRACNGN